MQPPEAQLEVIENEPAHANCGRQHSGADRRDFCGDHDSVRAAHIRQHLAGTLVGQRLPLNQADRQRPQAWTILCPARRFRWERARADLLTPGTVYAERLVFGDLEPDRRQIPHLAPLHAHHLGGLVQQQALARRTHRGPALLHHIGGGDQTQGLAGMAQLPARALPARAPQAAGARELALRPIRGRRFAAVVAIFRQSRFQLPHRLQQLRILLQQRGDLRTLLGRLGSKRNKLFLWRHTPMLSYERKSA